MAREQGALFWKLRVALSLARLLRGQGRSADAMEILGRFTTASPKALTPPISRGQKLFSTPCTNRALQIAQECAFPGA